MVDKYLTCTLTGCGGVAQRLGGDARTKKTKYLCGKCGHTFEIDRINVEAGIHTFGLPDPNDPLRGQVK